MRHRLFVVFAILVLAALVLVGWKSGNPLRHNDNGPVADPVPIASADLSGAGPGTLVSAMTMPQVTHRMDGPALQAARVVYRSTSGDTGAPTEVSGAVFVPARKPPAGGWPVVAVAHGTTGLDEPCAPSLSSSLLGLSEPVAKLVGVGYAVAVADYQGLGSPGIHPYTDARTAGLNVIDSVRALRHTFPGVSDRWAAYGGSQGGGASWAADEQAGTYAPEMTLVGAVATVPAADVSGVVDKAQRDQLTIEQQAALVGIVESLARLHPEMNRDDFRRGAAARYWNVLIACSGPDVSHRDDAIEALQPGDIAPGGAGAADQLRRYLTAWALPQQRLSAPMSVVIAGKDTYIDAQWTLDAVARTCSLGGTVDWEVQEDKGHGDVDIAKQFTWIADRFAGKPVHSECPQ